jgi:hypothetical protein
MKLVHTHLRRVQKIVHAVQATNKKKPKYCAAYETSSIYRTSLSYRMIDINR